MSAKRPSTMRADRLALERAGGGAADVALGDRDAKMIRPERDQPLDEADRRGAGLLEPRLRVGAKELLLGPAAAFIMRGRRRRGVVAGGDGGQQRGDARAPACRAWRGAPASCAVALLLAPPVVVVDGLQDLRRRRKLGIVDASPRRRVESSASSASRGSPERTAAPGRAPRPNRLNARAQAPSAAGIVRSVVRAPRPAH